MGIFSRKPTLLTSPEILQEIYHRLQREHSALAVDLTDNKDEHWSGGRTVNFGWYDEHRYNSGWFNYREMMVFRFAGREWAVGIGIAEGGYTMNGYHSDLRLFPLPDRTKETSNLVERVDKQFREEGWFKSTVLIAEDQFYEGGRLYFPEPEPYSGWRSDKLRWNGLVKTNILRDKLPEKYGFTWDFDEKHLLESSDEKTKHMYDPELVQILANTIEELLAIHEYSPLAKKAETKD